MLEPFVATEAFYPRGLLGGSIGACSLAADWTLQGGGLGTTTRDNPDHPLHHQLKTAEICGELSQ